MGIFDRSLMFSLAFWVCMCASAALLECNYGVIGEHSKKVRILKLNEDYLKITILKTNTPYPSRRYGVSVPALTKDHRRLKINTPYPEDLIRRIQDMESI
ncbi:hypothetical protein Tco_1125685 [Tanacetum coccineum]|uniref:Uncharacterized protein n=1 Tax=Tanacetum coccineum TaxID=301880 RepID=A0ABQ5J9M6_9ASTR